jgi:hypothetical protein
MFRSIRGTLEKRNTNVEGQKNSQQVAQEVVNAYAQEVFGEAKVSGRIIVVYDPAEQQLSIETGSKAVASEFLMRAGDLSSLLRQRGVGMRRLIVR